MSSGKLTNQNYANINSFSPSLFTGQNNGRIDIMSPPPSFNIPTYNKSQMDNKPFRREATLGQLNTTDLSDVFFSQENIEALQQGIRYRIYSETNGRFVIGRQSDQELKIVMRSIYYQYAKNDGTDIIAQTRELNAKVLDWAVPEVLSNLMQFQTYKKDASTLPMPLEHPPYMGNKGLKGLEHTSFL